MIRSMLCALALATAALAQAQTTAPASAAKKELVQKLLQLQQPGLEMAARGLVERPAAQMLQQAGQYMQTQIPAERREAIGKAVDADVKKYVDDTVPLVRDKAVQLAPSTIGVAMEEKFTEDELKQLIAWYESPVNKKFQQVTPEIQNSFMQKLVAESRPLVQPQLQALEQKVRGALGVPSEPSAPPAAGAEPPAAKPAKPVKSSPKTPAK